MAPSPPTVATWLTSKTTATNTACGCGRQPPAGRPRSFPLSRWYWRIWPSVQAASTSTSRALRHELGDSFCIASRPSAASRRRFSRMSTRRSASRPMAVSSCSCAAPEARHISSLPPLEGALSGFWQREHPHSRSCSSRRTGPRTARYIAAPATESEQGLAVVHHHSPGRRRSRSRTLHERQSHRPSPLVA